MGANEEPAAIRLGTVVEMIHTATLVHDDVIDKAETRRGQPSINSRWGNHMSVLAGDWLYMQAFSIALAERNFKILDLLIGLTQVMVEGELLQMEKLGRLLSREEHLDLIYRKTACLFEVSMRLGAVLAGANHVRGGAPAHRQAERVHQNGFARAGFARKQIQSGLKFQRQLVNDRVILNEDFAEHGRKV